MWLFGGAFGVGGEKRGRLRYRNENVLKKHPVIKCYVRSRIKRAANNKKTAAHKTLGQLPKL